jgi:hypothetical protein
MMRAFLAMNESLNSATSLTAQIGGKDERESFRRAIGNVMQTIYIDLMMPVIKQYPDLDPDSRPPA